MRRLAFVQVLCKRARACRFEQQPDLGIVVAVFGKPVFVCESAPKVL